MGGITVFRAVNGQGVAKFLLVILLVVQTALSTAEIVDQQVHPSETLLQIFRAFSPLLKNSCALDAEEIDKILDPQIPCLAITLQSLSQLAQDKFKRPADQERYQILGTPFEQQIAKYDTPRVRALLEALGSIQALYPSEQRYDYLLVNGSTVKIMRKRLKTLIDYVGKGQLTITPTVQVIFLTGDRDLLPNEIAELLLESASLPRDPNRTFDTLVKFPKNEYQAARWIWRETKLPPALRRANVTFVNAAKQRQFDASGVLRLRRPNTLDTVQIWLRSHPKPGCCLSISNQPYVVYQETIIRAAFNHPGLSARGFTVEGAGDRAPEGLSLALLMDNLARTLYATLQCDN